MIKIEKVRLPLDYTEETLYKKAAEILEIEEAFVEKAFLFKRETVTKDKEDVHFLAQIGCKVNEQASFHYSKNVKEYEIPGFFIPKKEVRERPVVVGSGPAGLFAALVLAKAGLKPIVLERGEDVDSRAKKTERFFKTGVLDEESNVQFGEGGAGTFSDGKLKPGKIDGVKYFILSQFVKNGADPEILYLAKPHVGTDVLHIVVKNLRKEIISLGGEFIFRACVNDFKVKDNKICAVMYKKDSSQNEIETNRVIFAIGHSARDTYRILYSKGISMIQRPFTVGVRIEHPQKYIDKLIYGRFAGHKALGAADYHLVTHLPNGHNVYSFCMCPGGQVVAATSCQNQVVTNGMSLFARNGENANSALLITVNQDNIKSDHPLGAIEFAEEVEKKAFVSGGGGFKAPICRLDDFLNGKEPTFIGDVKPSYEPGTNLCSLEEYLPKFATESLKAAIYDMDAWMPGYNYGDAIITGAETRSTSPVRILRDQNLEASVKGIFPCGEGAGYAGGIISAAVDGINCAVKIINSIN